MEAPRNSFFIPDPLPKPKRKTKSAPGCSSRSLSYLFDTASSSVATPPAPVAAPPPSSRVHVDIRPKKTNPSTSCQKVYNPNNDSDFLPDPKARKNPAVSKKPNTAASKPTSSKSAASKSTTSRHSVFKKSVSKSSENF
ncbi:hypothetical protein BB558_007408 [Smittium angustum]|uniref:Uncharacterized protein n=1 Tax=Smittium angustum TaxID=133377 RepID=A0A2U1IV38_SMIAN|nr:hypothetical protein BB558_007408 [Smittium angustum]